LFGDTISDFRRLPSSETLTLLGIGAAAAAIGHTKDWSVTNRFSVSRLEDTFEAGQLIGSARVQLGGALATYTLGRLTGRTRVAEVGADLFRAQVVAQALTAGVKLSVRRNRPDGSEFSFPSGHTSTTFASATVLQRHFGWKVGVPAYAVASYVAASRIQVKRHFLSDVAFGAALGVIAGRTVTVGRGQATFAVAPTAAPGGAGVSFTWVGKQ
jgi:membrane-associated phospholipid phosphatase